VGGLLSDVRIMLRVIVGVKTGRKTAEKVEPTKVVEGGRCVRENQNLEVSCTDFVRAWSPSWNGSDHSHVVGSPK
jgi:hypothetical protein